MGGGGRAKQRHLHAQIAGVPPTPYWKVRAAADCWLLFLAKHTNASELHHSPSAWSLHSSSTAEEWYGPPGLAV